MPQGGHLQHACNMQRIEHHNFFSRFDAKQKEVEAIANPIMQKVYQAAGGASGEGGMPYV